MKCFEWTAVGMRDLIIVSAVEGMLLFIYLFISQKCNIQHVQDTPVQSESEWCNKTQ